MLCCSNIEWYLVAHARVRHRYGHPSLLESGAEAKVARVAVVVVLG